MEKEAVTFSAYYLHAFYVSQEDIDTLDSSAHYLSFKFYFSFDISARMWCLFVK